MNTNGKWWPAVRPMTGIKESFWVRNGIWGILSIWNLILIVYFWKSKIQRPIWSGNPIPHWLFWVWRIKVFLFLGKKKMARWVWIWFLWQKIRLCWRICWKGMDCLNYGDRCGSCIPVLIILRLRQWNCGYPQNQDPIIWIWPHSLPAPWIPCVLWLIQVFRCLICWMWWIWLPNGTIPVWQWVG